jgi:hypothetical protein
MMWSPPSQRRRARHVIPVALLATLPGTAQGHGAEPRVTSIVFPAPLGGAPLLITDTQGIFGYFGAEPRWLCEDAIAPNATIVGMAATATAGSWLVASTLGVYLSTDDACTFARAAGLPDDVAPSVLSAHPLRPDEMVLLASSTEGGGRYGVYRTLDGGRTFMGPDLFVEVPWRTLLRDPEAPDRLYLSGNAGTYRSDDAGASWAPISVSPRGEAVAPGAVEFLAARPGADEVWAVVQQVPEATVIRSRDHGATWEPVTTVPDLVDRLVFDSTGGRALISTLFGYVARSDTPDTVWSLEQAPAPGFGCVTRGPEPGDDTLYACANPFLTATWTLARSDDFGRTWRSELTSLAAVSARWACGTDTPAVTACVGQCPGLPPGATCESPDAQGTPPDAGPQPVDARAPVTPDARVGQDALVADAEVGGEARSGTGDCRAAPGTGGGWGAIWALACLGLAARRRARRSPTLQGR